MFTACLVQDSYRAVTGALEMMFFHFHGEENPHGAQAIESHIKYPNSGSLTHQINYEQSAWWPCGCPRAGSDSGPLGRAYLKLSHTQNAEQRFQSAGGRGEKTSSRNDFF